VVQAVCVSSAVWSERNFDTIDMHGTTIKIIYLLVDYHTDVSRNTHIDIIMNKKINNFYCSTVHLDNIKVLF
jgi:hypothetical protein